MCVNIAEHITEKKKDKWQYICALRISRLLKLHNKPLLISVCQSVAGNKSPWKIHSCIGPVLGGIITFAEFVGCFTDFDRHIATNFQLQRAHMIRRHDLHTLPSMMP